jgi:hypothetical protein
MENIFTHILCIKVWSKKNKISIKDSNTEKLIKEMIVNKSQKKLFESNYEKFYVVKWYQHKWDKPYDEMIPGDLVTNLSYDDDIFIYEHTTMLLKKIENELKFLQKINEEECILFTIFKQIGDKNQKSTYVNTKHKVL